MLSLQSFHHGQEFSPTSTIPQYEVLQSDLQQVMARVAEAQDETLPIEDLVAAAVEHLGESEPRRTPVGQAGRIQVETQAA